MFLLIVLHHITVIVSNPPKSSNATEKNSLSLFAQVKSEYAQLKEILGAVTKERDLAVWERNQLQGKLENLEQVLKVRKPAAKVSRLCAFLILVFHPSRAPNLDVFTQPNPLPVPLLLPVLHYLHLVIFRYTI